MNKQIAKKPAGGKSVSFMANGTNVELSIPTVRNYLVSGDKDRVTDQEIVMFINLCKFSNLNPWLREAYCIKYGNEPATMVTGKSAFEKRAEANPNMDGAQAGVIAYDEETGTVENRVGSMTLPGEKIIGGWAEVWRKDRGHSTRVEVSFEEYAGRKRDGSLNGQWRSKPGTMIRKVALVQALREAFPNSFGGLYDAAEVNVDEEALDAQPIEQPKHEEPPKREAVDTEYHDADAPAEEPEEQVSMNDL